LSVDAPAPGVAGTPGEPLHVDWQSSDPDRITRVVVEFAPDAGDRVRLAEADGSASNAVATLPCLGPADVPGELIVTAFDEHGHADATSASQRFTLRGGACSAPLATYRASPSPFRHALSLFAPGAGELRVLDASGRLVRRMATSGGEANWDGRDDHGTAAGAGIYWVRFSGAAGTATKRVVKLGR